LAKQCNLLAVSLVLFAERRGPHPFRQHC